jgi:hypothetical protein
MAGTHAGECALIPQIALISSSEIFPSLRKQFSVQLAYGMTINKAQIQSVKQLDRYIFQQIVIENFDNSRYTVFFAD